MIQVIAKQKGRNGTHLSIDGDQAEVIAAQVGERASRWSEEATTIFFCFHRSQLSAIQAAAMKIGICVVEEHLTK